MSRFSRSTPVSTRMTSGVGTDLYCSVKFRMNFAASRYRESKYSGFTIPRVSAATSVFDTKLDNRRCCFSNDAIQFSSVCVHLSFHRQINHRGVCFLRNSHDRCHEAAYYKDKHAEYSHDGFVFPL